MRAVRRMIVREVAVAIVMIVVALAVVLLFMQTLDALSVRDSQAPVTLRLLSAVLELPATLYPFLPMCGFMAVLVAINRLDGSHQLVIFRCSGVSLWQMMGAFCSVAVIYALVTILVGEWLAPHGQALVEREMPSLPTHRASSRSEQHWFKQGGSYIHVEKVHSPESVSGYTQWDFDVSGQLHAMIFADHAEHGAQGWRLKDVTQLVVRPKRYTLSYLSQLKVPWMRSAIGGVRQSTDRRQSQSFSALQAAIARTKQLGLSTVRMEYQLWKRASAPITSVVMFILALCFLPTGPRRMSSSGRLLFGLVLGFSFYLIDQLFPSIAVVYQWSPWATAITPTLIYAFLCGILLFRCSRR